MAAHSLFFRIIAATPFVYRRSRRKRVIYVLTHDSIGLGEDGPTHQPVEHVMSLRLIPNLEVFRPCDTIETAECWELALRNQETPSVLALSRQNLPQLRRDADENRCARGGYLLQAAKAARRVVIVATGSEVEIAVATADMLEKESIGADVVSLPSWSRFMAQDADYRGALLPRDALIVSVEAGATFGWEAITGLDGLRFGVDSFGLSAPASEIYEYFGLTADHIAPKIKAALSAR